MNKIELLPKDIYYKDDLYQVRMWVTAFGRLCIGYRMTFGTNHSVLFSVCVEPENTSIDIKEPGSGWMNEGIGNTRTLDYACDMLQNYINKNSDEFKIY